MIAHSEIRQMPLPEKLALLEAVWAEISLVPDQVEIPQWHKDVLDERATAESEVLDWDVAKEQIQKMTR